VGISVADCIFCSIIAGEMPSTRIAETETVLVIKDIAPKAPIHYLIIPKKHIPDIQSLQAEDAGFTADMIMMAQKLSQDLPDAKAFRLVINSGADAGQCVFHVHMHFLSGQKMSF